MLRTNIFRTHHWDAINQNDDNDEKKKKNQVSLASRFDSYGNDPSGQIGRQWRAEVEDKIEKWQELQTAKTKKALPKPDDMPARKRGGKRCVCRWGGGGASSHTA